MLITVIPIKNYPTLKKLLDLSIIKAAGVELRFDYLLDLDFKLIKNLLHEYKLPTIFTLRSRHQGGFYPFSEEQRAQDLLSLCALAPDYLDLEYDVPESLVVEIKTRYPKIKLIASYHNFQETPADLMQIFYLIKRPYFDAYKIATFANSTLDSLRMLCLVNSLSKDHQITGLCMGEYGECTRILSPVVGSFMCYAVLDKQDTTAPGQLTIHELCNTYNYKQLNCATKIYALLGDPVESSIGHLFHNQAILLLQENAVYVKLRVTPNELAFALELCRQLPFYGFSITMPLKELIVDLLDEIDQPPIGAINSVVKVQQKFIGFNTDGAGALTALSKHVNVAQQTLVILGAGGAAHAIADAAIIQKANVIILNRNLLRAQKLAQELGCIADELQNLHKYKYQILINTLPVYIPELTFKANIIAMDIVQKPVKTEFLQQALDLNCKCVYGYEMYIEQALLQLKRWF